MLLTSCGISREAASNLNVAQTKVVLEKRNFKIVGTVKGKSTQAYYFGIGGLSKKSLTESAMSEMYKNAHLKGSQAIINVTVTYKSKFILIYEEATAIATGTVIQFVDDMSEPTMSNIKLSSNPQAKVHEASIQNNLFEESYFENPDPSFDKHHFLLTYCTKKKTSDKWIIKKEKRIFATFKEAQEKAENWNSSSDKFYDYKCIIKKTND